MKNKHYIIFDLDGTLVDSFPTVVSACKHVFENHAPQAMPDDKFFVQYRFKDIEQMFEDLAALADITTEGFRRIYDDCYAHDYINGSSIIKRQYDILKASKAKGIGIIVITNKKQEIAEEVCLKMFGEKMIDIVIGRKDAQPIKPKPIITERIGEFGIDPKHCLGYYGDSITDMQTARLLKVKFYKC